MENPENTTPKKGMFQPALNFGFLISVAVIVLILIFYLAGDANSQIASWIGFAFLLGGVGYGIYNYRENNLGGFISHGRAIGFGTLTGLMAGLITGAFVYALYSFIAPELLNELRNEAIAQAETAAMQSNPDVSNDELDMIVNMTTRFVNPAFLLIGTIFRYTLFGLLTGIIAGLFLKKAPHIDHNNDNQEV